MRITINMVEEQDKDTEDNLTEDTKEESTEESEEKSTDESGESTEESTEEESSSDQSDETEKPVTAEDAMDLAKSLQKGYTLTRQDMSDIRKNQDKIQEALEKLGKKDEFEDSGDEPLTVKGFLALQKQQQEAKKTEDTKFNQRIERDLDELRFQGVIKTDEDKDELLKFAVKRKITNLSAAAERWQELKNARKEAKEEGLKEGLKGKVKADTGANVGTSKKTGTKEQGVDINEIRNSTLQDLAEE